MTKPPDTDVTGRQKWLANRPNHEFHRSDGPAIVHRFHQAWVTDDKYIMTVYHDGVLGELCLFHEEYDDA